MKKAKTIKEEYYHGDGKDGMGKKMAKVDFGSPCRLPKHNKKNKK